VPQLRQLDGLQLNGLQLNGLQLNGLQLNGLQLNRLHPTPGRSVRVSTEGHAPVRRAGRREHSDASEARIARLARMSGTRNHARGAGRFASH
jgi:hypothetical protein